MSEGNRKKAVHLRLRSEEREHLDEVVNSVSGTRSELMRESIYLLIRLWNVYSAECEKRDVEPDHAEFGMFLRSVEYDPEPVFGVKR
jgi:hypothetical protein